MKKKTKLNISLLVATFLILVSHFLGVKFNLYVKISFYDKVSHLLAGLWVALIGIKFFYPKIFKKESKKSFLIILLFVLGIGILWEFFEFFLTMFVIKSTGVRPNLQPSLLDTLFDIIFNLIGSLPVILFTKIKTSKQKRK